MKKWIRTLAVLAAAATGAGAVYWYDIQLWPRHIRLTEEILFDELDLYAHSADLKNIKPNLEPERVRRVDAEYFLRGPSDNAASGRFYGELNILGKSGGTLIFLPRAIDRDGAVHLSVRYRKTNPESRFVLAIHYDGGRPIENIEGESSHLPFHGDTSWHEAIIPLAGNIEKGKPFAEESHAALANLRHYRPPTSDLYGIQLGLTGAVTGDSLFFDRVAIGRYSNGERVIKGRVTPRLAGVEIELRTPRTKIKATTGLNGRFRLPLEDGIDRYELQLRYENTIYLPTAGRYFEAGSYLTPVTFVASREIPAQIDGPTTGGIRVSTRELAEHYAPRSYFFHARDPREVRREYFVEKSVNRVGYPNRDHRYANPDQIFRVVVLGGCNIEGLQIDSQDHLGSQAEAISLFSGARRIEVITLANNYVDLTQWWPAYVNHALKLKPDLVVMTVFSPDSFRQMFLDENAATYRFDPKHPLNHFFRWNAKAKVLTHVEHDPSWRLYPKTTGLKPEFDWNVEALRVPPARLPEKMTQSIELIAESLKLFDKAAKAQGARFVLGNVSTLGKTLRRKWNKDGIDYDDERFLSLVKQTADTAGVEYFDFMQVVRQQFDDLNGKNIFFYAYDGHWSPSAHRAFAEGLTGYIDVHFKK